MDVKNILIVEDERNLALTLSQALRLGSDGRFQVEICENAEDALSKMDEMRYDLVISDLRLPGMDGLELVAQINREHEGTRSILMTGFGSGEVEAQAQVATDGYLPKPFDMLDLLIMVQKVVLPKKRGEKALSSEAMRDSNASRRIMILEDDPGLRRIYTKALTKAHYEVLAAATMNEARHLLETEKVDIFICDIHVGRERGTDLLAEYQERLAENGTQIVMASAYGQYRHLTEEMGADFFLEKPISLGTLLTLVSRLIDKPKEAVS